MLGNQRFQFETPNVIDSGEEPPVRPQRLPSDDRRLSETSSTSGSDDNSYQQERVSRQRLINSVSAIELNPEPYDPYDEEQAGGHSLPTPEQARADAMALVQRHCADDDDEEEREKRPIMSRTVKILSPNGHATRNRILPILFKSAVGLGLLLLGGLLGGLLARANRQGFNTKEGASYRSQMMKFLEDKQVSSRDDMLRTGSPQHQALLWLSTRDALQPPIPKNGDDKRFVQRYVLVVTYYALGGPDWKHQLNFLTSQDECAWSHASSEADFVDETFALGVSCDQDLQVRGLVFNDNGLQGRMPTELKFLHHLELVSLSNNKVTGPIPHLASLSELEYLDFKYNELTGTLPRFVGELPRLQVLGLSNNNMTGVLPASLAGLTRLHTLAIDDNDFEGSLAFANSLTMLEFLYADRNNLVDTVDETFLANLSLLTEVDLSSNKLKSTAFPTHLLQLPRLSVLDLSDNELQGPLPSLTTTNTAMRFLSLRYNLLDGVVDPLCKLERLTHLDIYDNRFTGTLPGSFESLKSLTYLFAGFNSFSAQPLPSFLIDMTELRELGLQAANLHGGINDWLGLLSKLRLLDLSENSLHGKVPQQVYNIPTLSYLLLNENALTGTVPASVHGADQLKLLTLHKTNITGDLTPLCNEALDYELFATDCDTIACSDDCCPTCCASDEEGCFLEEMNSYLTVYEGLWEYGFARASFALDPYILDEVPVAQEISGRDNEPIP